jgi:F-type H+-transporting ATPase subunit gamma
MANTRAIRRRIKSVKNTSQITKAMQMVAASRMRKAQNQALAGRPYVGLLETIGVHLHEAVSLVDFTHPLLEVRSRKNVCSVVISTDRGLCGALNANLLREVSRDHDEQHSYITVGRKGRQFLARLKRNMLADFEIKDHFTFRESKRISQFFINQYMDGTFDAVDIYYSKFINTIRQEPLRVRLLPLGAQALGLEEKKSKHVLRDYLFEPGPEQLLGKLLPNFVHIEFYQMLLDAKASEHSARMVAMKNATDNAKQIIKDLTLEYNKERQAAITKELLEITTAQMAME